MWYILTFGICSFNKMNKFKSCDLNAAFSLAESSLYMQNNTEQEGMVNNNLSLQMNYIKFLGISTYLWIQRYLNVYSYM